MILHPGILALLLGSAMVLVLMILSSWTALQVLRRWDPDQADERQLSLERRTYLVSTLVHYALGFTVLSLPLFLYTLDDLHPLFTGAMCATGSLNANPIGWLALFAKLLLVLLAGCKSQGLNLSATSPANRRQNFCRLHLPIVDHACDPVNVLSGGTVERGVTVGGCLGRIFTVHVLDFDQARVDQQK